ncbi:MAG TPA: carboxylate--amine ligase/circularly permuted type 2 ATP-grasp protein [Polyangiales bacterium]|nr:carboxylate--amine ligase/circularly permuted type 2 ATP-grasp protein [Polyangiales bacterium]
MDASIIRKHDQAAQQAFNPLQLTLGVEEEFHLVDLETRHLTPRAGELLDGLAASTGTFTAELQQSVVETNTDVARSLPALRHNLVQLRTELVHTAHTLGVGVASAGTMPLSVPLALTETPRFRRMLADYQLLVREQLICGMQVHVGIPDRDVAVRLMDRVGPWLPPLLALSSSSPFSHAGADTGYASSRSLIWSRWPTAGLSGSLESAAEYDALVQKLIASGVISDAGMIYFDVRPSSHVPTLELRVCDACPAVDTVVLIAGLFRAIVARELSRLAAGEGPSALPPALYRAAMWRAARSGLEGELIDLSVPRSVPAGVLVRGVVQELRPELEAYGDWESVHELSEAAMAHGSAAARQREAFRKSERITDVVDLIVAETAGLPVTVATEPAPARLLAGYRAPGYDEALFPDGRFRPSHARPLEGLCALSPAELRDRRQRLESEKQAAGVVFRVADQERASEFPIDLVPRALSGEEWSRLQGGTAQRTRALDAFLRDIYGEAAIVRDGVFPAQLAARCPGRSPAAEAWPSDLRRIQVAGFDIVRDADGRWLVLEDNVRVPSGVAFAMQNRRLMRSVLPELVDASELLDPEEAPALLQKTLEECAPPAAVEAGKPSIALVSEGPTDSAYFEHRMLSDEMACLLAQPHDLYFQGEQLFCAEQRIDVLYVRMDDVLSALGRDRKPLGPKLIKAIQARTLTIANAVGNGLADDKAVYSYVPKFIEYYLGEHPLLEQVTTYHCSDPEQRRLVLSRLRELVVKPVDGYGGLGVVVGPHASHDELARARSLILQQPSRWIAQETVAISTHPTLERSRLRPHHVDLRVFVYYGKEPVVVPAALTRVAPAGSLIVNSSRGGGAKDTWLLR